MPEWGLNPRSRTFSAGMQLQPLHKGPLPTLLQSWEIRVNKRIDGCAWDKDIYTPQYNISYKFFGLMSNPLTTGPDYTSSFLFFY